jgi:hypothetical protein
VEVDRLRATAPSQRSAAYGRMWVRKEACVKAAGGRLTQGLGLPVGVEPDNVVVEDRIAGLGGPWRVADVRMPPGYAAAVALNGVEQFCQNLLVCLSEPHGLAPIANCPPFTFIRVPNVQEVLCGTGSGENRSSGA